MRATKFCFIAGRLARPIRKDSDEIYRTPPVASLISSGYFLGTVHAAEMVQPGISALLRFLWISPLTPFSDDPSESRRRWLPFQNDTTMRPSFLSLSSKRNSHLRLTAKAATIAAVFPLLCSASQAQTLPGTYTSSWVGNTFGKGGKATDPNSAWVQNYIDEMVVQPDGAINTKSTWDEHGRWFGIYKDGKVLGNEDKKINGREVFIKGQRWFIEGNVIKGPQTISTVGKPTALAKTNDDQLIVADDGPRKQVLFFDVRAVPRLVSSFGVQGGIGSAYKSSYAIPAAINSPLYPAGNYVPGVYHPFKLWDLTGVGMDARGRLFVSQSGGATAIRCFKKNPKGQWVVDFFLEGYMFVDNADVDASTDGLDIYTSQSGMRWTFPKSRLARNGN
jgi:hypothetical protein